MRASIAAALLAGCSSAAPPMPLDALVAFDDPYRCLPSKDLAAILSGTIQWREAGESYKGELARPPVPAQFKEQVGPATLTVGRDEYRATLPLRGTWQGLPLHSLVLIQWVESESGFYIVFDASRKQVLDAANKVGFSLPPSASRHWDGEVLGEYIKVAKYEGRTALSCLSG